jgi:hypothetical protein
MIRRTSMKVSYVLLIAAMALSAVGTVNTGWCGCMHAPESREMPTLSVPEGCTSCCDRCEPDHDCCCTFNDRVTESRADGFLPQSRHDDDGATPPQCPPESMIRMATGQHHCTEPAFTIARFPTHLRTTVLLI